MPSLKVATLALLLAFAQQGEAKMTKQKQDFVRKMRESEKINGPIAGSKATVADFLKKSVEVSSLKGSATPEAKVSKEELERRLNYYNNANGNTEDNPSYGGNYNSYNANSEEVQNSANWWSFWTSNNYDRSNVTSTEGMYDSGENITYAIESFQDLSVKYAGCSSTTSFSGDDEDSDSKFISNALVQYRLCPAESCEDDSWQGCTSEYGEYMMSLEDFLDAQSDIREKEFQMLCSYCKTCYEFNENYCDGDNCCTHSHDCEGYDESCSAEGDDDTVPSYEDLFDCMEVDGEDDGSSLYVGVHCNGLNIEVGLFSDSSCSSLLATEEQVNIAGLTGIDFNTEDLEAYFVPQGCLSCGGDDYNMKNNWWYHDGDKNEDDEEDYVNQVCYDMYSSSAKCNQNLSEDLQELLEESDDEISNEQITCDFIKQAVTGQIDEYGFVMTKDESSGFWDNLFQSSSETPSYEAAVRYSNKTTGGQAFALTFGMLGTAALAALAFQMKNQVDAAESAEGLIAKTDKQID